MSLKDVFHQGASTVFTVFKSLLHSVSYVVVTDDGFNPIVRQHHPMKAIVDSFTAKDVQTLAFAELIQPTDVKGLILGSSLKGISVSTKDYLVDLDEGNKEYAVVALSTDPAKAVFTLLLRSA